jgi:hypothetical protein
MVTVAQPRRNFSSAYLNGRTRETLVKQLEARLYVLKGALEFAEMRGESPDNDYIESYSVWADRLADEIAVREDSDGTHRVSH